MQLGIVFLMLMEGYKLNEPINHILDAVENEPAELQLKLSEHNLQLKDKKCNSDKLGNCERCGKYVNQVFYLFGFDRIQKQYISIFGHWDCLVKYLKTL